MSKVVQRDYHRAERGKLEELIELARESLEIFPYSGPVRHYTGDIGVDGQTFVFELEFENLAEYEKTWAAWWDGEETPAFMDKWNSISEFLRTEIWVLHELPE